MPPRPIGPARPGAALATRAAGTAAAQLTDNTDHGQWVANAEKVIAALAYIGQHQRLMVDNLTIADASTTQIRDVSAWSDNLTRRVALILAGLRRIDDRLGPLVDAVDQAGGWREVGSPGYHADY